MAAWSSQFVPPLLKGQHAISDQLGTDVMSTSGELYNINLTTLALIGMVMKAVQDIVPTTATDAWWQDRKSTRLNSSHVEISYAVFCLKKKKKKKKNKLPTEHIVETHTYYHALFNTQYYR